MARQNVYQSVSDERFQAPASRRDLFEKVSSVFAGRGVVTFFTSFQFPVEIEHDDFDMLQSVLQQTDLSNGLVLMINSPGGDAIAAERIVNICRAYSGTGDYWALIPGRAKSAATVICMGASKIIMAAPSELGPVDPQIIREENGETKFFSAVSLVTGYNKLFSDAVSAQGNVEPYIQQLARYDVREINRWQSFIDVSRDIAVKLLASGMMKGLSPKDIEKRIQVFLDPTAGTQHHGRAIYATEAKNCGLVIEELDVNDPEWDPIYELYYRTDMYVSTRVSKVVESQSEAFYAGIPA
jgi:ClpP class serine protease